MQPTGFLSIAQGIALPGTGCNSLKENIASWKMKIHSVFRHQQEHKGDDSLWELCDWLAAVAFIKETSDFVDEFTKAALII